LRAELENTMINDFALAVQDFANALVGILNELLAFMGIQIVLDPLDCVGAV
jgi:hypothetical protein